MVGGQSLRTLATIGIITALLMIFALPSGAFAGEAEFEKMNVSIQPEYDDPRVLAVFQGTLTDDTELPREAEFFIPKSSKGVQIGMACEVPAGQGHRCKVYDTKEAGDFQSLTYKVDSARDLFFEYYWDPFKSGDSSGAAGAAGGTDEDGKKSFVYEYKAAYPVKNLQINVQKPLKATEFEVEPATEDISKDGEGFEYYVYNYENVKKDQVFTINANYVKTDPGPSKPKASPGSVQPANVAAGVGEASTNQGFVRIMLFLFILLFAAGGVAVYWRSQLTPAAAPVAKPKKKAGGAKQQAATKSSAEEDGRRPKFCPNCGSSLGADHKFCPDCGDQI